jgi:hypothetical protein
MIDIARSFVPLQSTFGGSTPINLSEYYAGGAYVPTGVSYTNNTAGLSGAAIGNIPSSGTINLSDFNGTDGGRYWTWGNLPSGHPNSGYGISNSVSFSTFGTSIFRDNPSTGDTYLICAELRPDTQWYYSNTRYVTMDVTIGTAKTLYVPIVHSKQWRMYISYDGGFWFNIGGGYVGDSTNVPNGGCFLQGVVRTSDASSP